MSESHAMTWKCPTCGGDGVSGHRVGCIDPDYPFNQPKWETVCMDLPVELTGENSPTKKFEVISGLRLDVAGIELAQHCHSRIAYHKGRIAEREMKKAEREAKMKEYPKSRAYGIPPEFDASVLTDLRPQPEPMIRMFEFIGSHLIHAAVYRLSMEDLNSLEWF